MYSTDTSHLTHISNLPSKPQRANHGQPLMLTSNHYQFTGISGRSIHKYAVKFEPQLPDNSKVGGKLVYLAKEKLQAEITPYIYYSNCLYSV